MLAKIKFAKNSNANKLTEKEHSELEKFIGEPIKFAWLIRDEEGKLRQLSWRESFDEEYVKERSDEYKLVEKSGYVQLDSDDFYLADLNKVMEEYPSLEYTVKGLPKAIQSESTDMIHQMNLIAEKIEDAKNKFTESVQFNQRCEVHVPNLGLLNINKLAYATDYCTENLQELLLMGWRIIAVCPQPDQRRPDYILGMNVTGFDDNVDVVHFSGDGKERQ